MNEETTFTGLKQFNSGYAVLTATSPTYNRVGGIDLVVTMAHIDGDLPYTVNEYDDTEHGKWLYEQATAGAFGEVGVFDRPLPTLYDLQSELDKIWPDVVLGLATDDELALAKNLRIQIKTMQ